MPDPRAHDRRARARRERQSRGAHRQRPPAQPRHTAAVNARSGARQQREARLARTVAAVIVALALLSALTGYLLHGSGQSAAGAAAYSSTRPTGPVATPAATTSASGATSTSPPASGSGPSGSAPSTATGTKPVTVPATGAGKFVPVTVPQTTTVRTGRLVTYSLRVEGGMHADTAAIARAFGSALLDRRGWQGVDHVRFVQVTPRQVANGTRPRITVLVASPVQVAKLCAPLPTHGDTSCETSAHVVLNYKLWMRGVPYFKGLLDQYREYMVNHEVGHALGHGHQYCSRKGAYAPVMQQQTLGLHGCQPWPWPKRPNARGTA